MLKRSFWLVLAATGGWLVWYWVQRRREELNEHATHFAPPRPFEPAARSIPADDDQVAPVTVPPPAPRAPAPPPAEPHPQAAFAPADDDQVAAQPDPDEALRAAAPAEAPAAAVPPPAVSMAAPEAPPSAGPSPQAQPDDEEAIAGYDEVIGYCVRCRAKRPIQNAHEELSESGRRAARGTCPVCGANMFTFLAANDDEGEAAP